MTVYLLTYLHLSKHTCCRKFLSFQTLIHQWLLHDAWFRHKWTQKINEAAG